MMDTTETPPSGDAKLWDLIMDIKVAMMTTFDYGVLRSRPMLSHPDQKSGIIWFLTRKSDPKMAELAKDSDVNLSYVDIERSHFVSVSATARVSNRHEKLDEIWSSLERAWFPEGPQDPALTLLEVIPQQAEYWDTERRGMLTVAEFIKAAHDGTLEKMEDHHKIDTLR